jgi:transcriptional activator SPT7
MDDEDLTLEGKWWTSLGLDEGYTSALPVVPFMPAGVASRRKRIPRKKTTIVAQNVYINGDDPSTPSSDRERHRGEVRVRAVNLGHVVYDSVEKLSKTRKLVMQTLEFQRAEAEGGILPVLEGDDERIAQLERRERRVRRRKQVLELHEGKKRRRIGGDVGEREAVEAMKKVTAGMLAHSGFEGESPMSGNNTESLLTLRRR